MVVKDMKPITSLKRKSEEENIETAKLEKIKVDLKKDAESPPEAGLPSAEKIERKVDDTKSEISKDSRQKTDTTESESKNEALRDNYYLKVREKIKSMLEKYGRRFMKEGDVYVRFVVKRDGTLRDLMLYKKSGKNMRILEQIAIKSIKEASPFPVFDESMKESELPFDLPIRFSLHR